jgi:hypothetical protein
MASINIPKSAYQAIQSLTRLKPSDFEALLEALSKATPALGRGNFWSHVAPLVPQIKADEVKTIVNEILDMSEGMDILDMGVDEFATAIAESSVATNELKLSQADEQLLRERLIKVFVGRRGLCSTLKAMGVMVDQERTFYSARILTDVRPVFDEKGETVDAAVIVHNLRIHYGQDSEHKDFYVSLDTSDIADIREALDRADAKAKSLEGILKRSGVSFLDADE